MRFLTIILSFFISYMLTADEYNVDSSKDNLVKFTSDAPLEEFHGTTSNIDGYLLINPNDPVDKSEMYFEVDLNTIKTGIGLRDRHMRENYLETDKFPRASFTGQITEANKGNGVLKVKVEGEFEIHGETHPIKIDGEMEKVENGYKIKTNFIVALSNHKIEVPSVMFKKIDENMAVELNFFLIKV